MNDTSYSVVLSGEAGQGLKTIESLLYGIAAVKAGTMRSSQGIHVAGTGRQQHHGDPHRNGAGLGFY